jgi:hypothetical protein
MDCAIQTPYLKASEVIPIKKEITFTQSLEVLVAPPTTVLQSATVAALYMCYFHIIKSFTFKAFLTFRE